MSTINQLPRLGTNESLVSGDSIPVWRTAQGAAYQASFSQLNALIQSLASGTSPEFVAQYEAPVAGATVQVTDSSQRTWLILTPAATLATLTIKLPAAANTISYQEIMVVSTQIITTLTIDGNGSAVVGGPTTISAANKGFKLKRNTLNTPTFYKVGEW